MSFKTNLLKLVKGRENSVISRFIKWAYNGEHLMVVSFLEKDLFFNCFYSRHFLKIKVRHDIQ